MNQQDFINQVFNSIDGIEKMNPKNDLFDKIVSRIDAQKNVSSKYIWLAAASIAALLIVNITILSKQAITPQTEKNIIFAQFDKSNQIYN